MTTISAQIYAYLNAGWTDISSSVEANPYPNGNWGMSSNSPTDRLAKRGNFNFSLKNTNGAYTPDGAAVVAGWKKGTKVKVVFTYNGETFVRWYGKVDTIDIDAGASSQRKVHVTALDWMDYAAKYPIRNSGVLSNKRADEGIAEILADIPIQPQVTDLGVGTETFPAILDNVSSTTRGYSEFYKFSMSELGMTYLKRDKVYGETLRFEPADYRNGLRTLSLLPSDEVNFLLLETGDKLLLETGDKLVLDEIENALFTDSMTDAEVVYGSHQINRITVTAYPRRIDTSLQVLYTLSYPLPIGSGQTITFRGIYTDPSGGATVNANPSTMVTPVINTDYKAWTNSDATGTDITASITISASYGSEGVTYTLTNTSANSGHITKLQARGYGIYIYNPVETTQSSSTSIAEYGYESETIHQAYQQSTVSGQLESKKIIEQEKNPRRALNRVEFVANTSELLTNAFLRLDVGDLVHIQEQQSEIDGWYFIQGVDFTLQAQGNGNTVVRFGWILKEHKSLLNGLSDLSAEFDASSTDGINFGYIPYLTTPALNEMTISCWIYMDTVPTSTDYMFFTYHSDNGGWILYVDAPTVPGDRTLAFYTTLFPYPGKWTINNRFNTGAWVHIVVTYAFSASADPTMYVNGTSYATTEELTPSGTLRTNIPAQIVIGNIKTSTLDYSRPFDGQVKDCRIYNRILTNAEVTTLYNGGTPSTSLVTNGLIFQALCVRTEDLADYTDTALNDEMKVLDNIRGVVGTPNGSPTGRAF